VSGIDTSTSVMANDGEIRLRIWIRDLRRSSSFTATMSDLPLQEIHDFAVALAKKAGEVILKASNSRLSTTSATMEEKMNCLVPGNL
jgi:hypothetical protein